MNDLTSLFFVLLVIITICAVGGLIELGQILRQLAHGNRQRAELIRLAQLQAGEQPRR